MGADFRLRRVDDNSPAWEGCRLTRRWIALEQPNQRFSRLLHLRCRPFCRSRIGLRFHKCLTEDERVFRLVIRSNWHSDWCKCQQGRLSATRYSAALPLTAAIDALRGNMLQGMPLTQLLAPVTVLLLWLLITFFGFLAHFSLELARARAAA
jgi:hypothetical protein